MDFGFIIVCKKPNQDLEKTISYISNYTKPEHIICVLPIKEPYSCKNTVVYSKGSSLGAFINKGMKASVLDWNFIIHSGTRVKTNLYRKFHQFIEKETDVLYPCRFDKRSFPTDFNGVLVNKKIFGKLDEFDDFDKSQTIWLAESCEKGCLFKGIVGTVLN